MLFIKGSCLSFLLILVVFCRVYGEKRLDTVSDTELLEYIKNEQFVVVLFSKPQCKECEKYETELVNLRDDLVDELSAWIIKVENSQLLKLYSPSKEPALVYFRNGIPLLYNGKINDDEIFQTCIDNKEPIVKELTDDNFEHLTQASSGSTTGDWFVMFYSDDCVDCQRMGARWEAVGAQLKARVNTARVNKYTTGASTARRFNVFDVPQFILFKQGKMYRYHISKYDVNAFVSFAKDWWKNAQTERVPVPLSPFDDLTQMIANFLRDNPWIMKLGSITMGVMIIVSVASKLRKKSETPDKKTE